MSDVKYESQPLPEMIDKPCKVCGELTLVPVDYQGDTYCINHDEQLRKELGLDV